jgi:hypothetical protein
VVVEFRFDATLQKTWHKQLTIAVSVENPLRLGLASYLQDRLRELRRGYLDARNQKEVDPAA